MKTFYKNSAIAAFMLSFILTISVSSPLSALAATTPSLGQAATYGVLASTYTDTSGATTVNGSVGFTTPPASAIGGTHTYYGSGAPYATAGTDQGTALAALAAQACTFTFGAGPIDLSTDITHGAAGVYVPGVYCSAGAMDVGGPLTLSGSGTYIFRPGGALTSTAGAIVTLSGASACDVFWTPISATTLAANTTFFGTVIDDAGITVGANTTWTGRALSFGGTVTTATDTITAPTCTTPGGGGRPQARGTINVVKLVINDNGGTKAVADFPLFVNYTGVISGETNTFSAYGDLYAVTETNASGYVATFSGDCDVNGQFNLNRGDNKFCIITNNDIGVPIVAVTPPLIDVVKTASPLALPNGPGTVLYTYTLRNIGTVPVTNITMVGDTCSPIVRTSGDTNGNNILEVTETWVHTCSTWLTETHTNTVVGTGWANGISATDIASATVIVGAPIVPPLIHVTKLPYPLALRSGPGMVTYTERITNPGTVALNNVTLTDNTCSPMTYISGDANLDNLLAPNETWTYTCRTRVAVTTTNTAIATGWANGLSVRDFAIATVVVSIPGLPATGLPPFTIPWNIILGVVVMLASCTIVFFLIKRKA